MWTAPSRSDSVPSIGMTALGTATSSDASMEETTDFVRQNVPER